MKEQFNSSSKQQQVKAELSKVSYATFVKNKGGNKRRALRNLQSQIENVFHFLHTTGGMNRSK